eukprot:4994965-Prymnesium_polylepis.1
MHRMVPRAWSMEHTQIKVQLNSPTLVMTAGRYMYVLRYKKATRRVTLQTRRLVGRCMALPCECTTPHAQPQQHEPLRHTSVPVRVSTTPPKPQI